MGRLRKWLRVLSMIMVVTIIVSSNGIATFAQRLEKSASSYIVQQNKTLSQNEDKIQLLSTDNSDFVIDINQVLVKYDGSDSIVTVPDGVVSIGNSAFDKGINGNGITEINLPDSVTSLQDYAFSGCHTVTSLTIPKNVSSIGIGVFYFSKGLKNIFVSVENPYFKSEDGILFNKDMTQLVCFPQARTQTSYVIPNTVKLISEFAFDNATSLTSITLPEGITELGKMAFRDCTFSEIVLPASLVSIGELSFARCKNLKSIQIPKGVKTWGRAAFFYCLALEQVIIEEGVISIGNAAFSNCTKLSQASIPKSVTTISEDAFLGCPELVIYGKADSYAKNYATTKNIAFVEVSDPVIAVTGVAIEVEAIYKVVGDTITLTAVVYPKEALDKTVTWSSSDTTVATVDESGVVNCVGAGKATITVTTNEGGYTDEVVLTISAPQVPDPDFTVVNGVLTKYNGSGGDVVIPSTVTKIDQNVFFTNSTINSVIIPDSVTEIGQYAFSRCSSLTSITIPGSVKNIGYSAFSNCDNLATVTIEEGITTISGGMFSNCKNLSTISLPKSLKSIQEYAFENCGFANKFIIPNSVETVEHHAFANCTGLNSITVANSTKFSYETFVGCNITDLTLSFGAPIGEDNLAYGMGVQDTLKNLTISSGITKIDGFRNCSKLEEVNMPSTLTEIGSWAFENCPMLQDLKLPQNLKIINDRSFHNITSLTEIEFPLSLKSIGNSSFQGCIMLKKVVIPSAQTKVDYFAFLDCSNLEEVTVQNGLYNDAFREMASVKTLRILPSDQYPEVECVTLNQAKTIIFEEGITSIGDIALPNITYYLPKSVTSIGHNGFTQITKPMYVYKASYAHQYAVTNQIPYILIGDNSDAVTGINIIDESKVILLGTESMLVHAVTPATAGNKNVTWKSSNPAIATVSEFGHVKGLKEGTVIITATTEEGGFSDSCEVTISKESKVTYEKDLTYMALSAMAYLNFKTSDAGKTCKQIIAENPENAELLRIFIKDIKVGEFIATVSGDWKYLASYNVNESNGYYGAAFLDENSGEIVLASRGTEDDKDYKEDINFGAFGTLGEQFVSCNKFYELIKIRFPNATITTTGHSLGGALGVYLAQRHGLKARVFNAPSATFATYAQEIRNVYKNFHGMELWDIIDYTNENCVIGNCGLGDNYSYASAQFGQFFLFYGLNYLTIDDFLKDGNIIAPGGSLDKTILCNDNAKINEISGTWNTHSLGSLVSGGRLNGKIFLEIDRKYEAQQTIPYKSETGLMADLADNLVYRKLLLGSAKDDILKLDGVINPFIAYGGDGSDIIFTGMKSDVIAGGEGKDFLDGGTSNDYYYFTKNTMNDDFIHDPSGMDSIYLVDLMLSDIEIDSVTVGKYAYYTITAKNGGNRIYIDKNRAILSPKFKIVGSSDEVMLLSEANTKKIKSFGYTTSTGVVTPIKIDGTATVEIYDDKGVLLQTFSNDTTSQVYENYGYFYGFGGVNPYTMIYLFNGDYKISVKSNSTIDYYTYSLEADDTAIMEVAVTNVNLSGDKTLITSTVPVGVVPELAVKAENQTETQLSPEIKGISDNLNLNKNQLTLEKKQTEVLLLTGEPSEKVIWSSSDPTVAEVDGNGKVTAKTVGTAIISATTESGLQTARCFVTVWAAPDPVIPELTPVPSTGGITIVGATEDKGVTDKKAADLVIAQIDALGNTPTEIAVKAARAAYNELTDAQKLLVPTEKLELLQKAEAYISSKLEAEKDNNEPRKDIDKAEKDNKPEKANNDKSAKEIKISKKKVNLFTGDTITLKITGTKSKVTWSSSKASVVTVSSKGKITARGSGTAIITATVNNKKYTCKVTVKKTIASPKVITMKIGDKKTLVLKGVSQKITWKSSDTTIVKVNKSGIVTSLGKGKATITATVDNKRYSFNIIVK